MKNIPSNISVDSTDKMISRAQLAELLGWKPASIAQGHWRGTLPVPYFKHGRLVRYRLSDVRKFIETRMATSPAAHAAANA